MIYVRDDLKQLFIGERTVADFLAIDGEVFKEFPTRKTLRFERGGRSFFIKGHWGVGWREIAKNIFSLRAPVIGARNEWRAIRALEAIGVNTMKLAAYGEEGLNPSTKKSFVLTEALDNTESLEKWAERHRETHFTRDQIRYKRALIERVAEVARKLHRNGINHRDFYLCHFLLELSTADDALSVDNIRLYVIDLHRVQVRRRAPQRWIVKDVSGLFFSSIDANLTSRDRLRFMRVYSGKSLRETLTVERAFWEKVRSRGVKTYRAHWGREPRLDRFFGAAP